MREIKCDIIKKAIKIAKSKECMCEECFGNLRICNRCLIVMDLEKLQKEVNKNG